MARTFGMKNASEGEIPDQAGQAKDQAGQAKDQAGRAKNPRWLRLVSAWTPVLVCTLAIAVESTPYFGSDHTSGPLRRLVESLFGPFSESVWANLHHGIRKVGHFTGYGILSLAWFRAFWMTYRPGIPPWRRLIASCELAMLGTFLVASSDEVHQLYLPNRTGSAWDVLLDCCGAATVQALVWVWMRQRAARQ